MSNTETEHLEGAQKCGDSVYCVGMQLALDKDYCYCPIQMRDEETPDGKRFVNLVVLAPAIKGKSKKLGSIVMNYCPWCGEELKVTP